MYIYLHIYMIYGYKYISYILINACSACRRSWNRYDFRSRIFAYFQGRYSEKKNILQSITCCKEWRKYTEVYIDTMPSFLTYSANTQFWFNFDICWNGVVTLVNNISTLGRRHTIKVVQTFKFNVETSLNFIRP